MKISVAKDRKSLILYSKGLKGLPALELVINS